MQRIKLSAICLVLLALTGCQESMTESDIDSTPSPRDSLFTLTSPSMTSLTETPTRPPRQTRSPTWTPPPLIDRDAAQAIVEGFLSNNGGCDLPCFWSIVPGVSTWEEVHSLLGPISSDVVNPYAIDSVQEGNARVNYQYNGMTVPIASNSSQDDTPTLGISFSFRDEILHSIVISQPSDHFIFSMDSLLRDLGAPSQVFIETYPEGPVYNERFIPFHLMLLYTELGVSLYFPIDGTIVGSNAQGCPAEVGPEIFLWNPTTRALSTSELVGFWMGTTIEEQGYEKPLDEATNLSIEEFFNIFSVEGPKPCILSPADAWID